VSGRGLKPRAEIAAVAALPSPARERAWIETSQAARGPGRVNVARS